MNPGAAARGEIPFLSRPSYRIHLVAAALEGTFSGCVGIVTFVAARAYHATRWENTLYQQAGAIAMLLSPLFAVWLARAPSRRVFLVAGIAGRLPLLATAAVAGAVPFLALAALHAIAQAAVLPTLNALWQANYPVHVRGWILGRLTVVSNLCQAATAFGVLRLLDASPDAVVWPFAAAGLVGTAAFVAFATIRLRRRPADPHLPVGGSAAALALRAVSAVPHPWRGAIALLRAHPRFAMYELGFMVYGFGFFFTQPFLQDFCERDLQLSYEQMAYALPVQQLVTVAASPFFGRLLDRWRAARTAALAFAILPAFALAFAGAHGPGMVAVGYVCLGAAMAGVNVCWTLGTVEFAGREDSARFMGVHAACVGVRTALAPLAAYAIQAAAGAEMRVPFAIAAVFFAAAVVIMWRLARDMEATPRPA